MSLYTAAKKTKLTINIGIGLIVAVLILKISYNAGYLLYRHFFPPEIPRAEVAYGKIPEIKLKSLPLKVGSTPQYRLETTTATLPLMPDRAPVYKLSDQATTISLERNAVEFAESLGFKDKRIEESSTDWVWQDTTNERTLKMNIVTNDFHLDSSLTKIAPTVARGSAPELEDAKGRAKGFVSSIIKKEDKTKEDFLDNATLSARFVRIKGNQPEVVGAKPEAQMVEVNFFIALKPNPSDYPGFDRRFLPEEYTVTTDDPDIGIVRIFVTNSSNPSYQLPIIDFSSQRLIENEYSTYPLKRIDRAWQEVADGGGKVAHLRIKGDNPLGPYVPLDLTRVDIRTISLSYFDTGLPYRQFLQPIFVFEGEAFTKEGLRARFVAYTAAVDPVCWGTPQELGKPCSLIE